MSIDKERLRLDWKWSFTSHCIGVDDPSRPNARTIFRVHQQLKQSKHSLPTVAPPIGLVEIAKFTEEMVVELGEPMQHVINARLWPACDDPHVPMHWELRTVRIPPSFSVPYSFYYVDAITGECYW